MTDCAEAYAFATGDWSQVDIQNAANRANAEFNAGVTARAAEQFAATVSDGAQTIADTHFTRSVELATGHDFGAAKRNQERVEYGLGVAASLATDPVQMGRDSYSSARESMALSMEGTAGNFASGNYYEAGRSASPLIQAGATALTALGALGRASGLIRARANTRAVAAEANATKQARLVRDTEARYESENRGIDASLKTESTAVESQSTMGTAQRRNTNWRPNQNGPRTRQQAIEIAEENGVDIGDDYVINWHSDEVYDRAFGTNSDANYGMVRGGRARQVTWRTSVADSEGRVNINLRASLLESDEAIVWVLKHEAYEIEELRKVFHERGSLSWSEYDEMVRAGKPDNLHCCAVDDADRTIREMRKNNGNQ